MLHVNLLPWREQYYKYRHRFLILLVAGLSLVFSVVLAGLTYWLYHQKQRTQFEVAQLLSEQSQLQQLLLHEKTVNDQLTRIAKQQEVRQQQNLQAQKLLAHLHFITQNMPDEVWFSSLLVNQDHWTLSGKTFALKPLFVFLQLLEKTLAFEQIAHLQLSTQHHLYTFIWEGRDA